MGALSQDFARTRPTLLRTQWADLNGRLGTHGYWPLAEHPLTVAHYRSGWQLCPDPVLGPAWAVAGASLSAGEAASAAWG